jgi:DNA-binding transcriptional LysR family regulator
VDLPDPDSLRCFVSAARLSSFSRAARSVGLTPAAVGQRIARLEGQLGRNLFERNGRRVSLSKDGLAFLPSAEKALSELAHCLHAGRGGGPGPEPVELILGTRHELGMAWIVPLLPQLRRALPHLTIHLYFGSGSDLLSRLVAREIQVSVGSMRSTHSLIGSTKLCRHEYLLVASPDLLAKKPFSRFEQAQDHTLVDVDPLLSLFAYFREAAGPRAPRFANFSYMGTVAAIRSAVLAGDGVAVLPKYLIHADVRAGRLAVLFPHITLQHDYFRLFYRTDDPRLNTYEALAAQMQRTPPR